MKVLIIGNGGREHALAWKIVKSPLLTKLFIASGNGGTDSYKDYNIGIEITDTERLRRFAIKEKIDLTVVGSEVSIDLGIADRFREKGLKIFAPSMRDALLETSKVYSKLFMLQKEIPTADFEFFTKYDRAMRHIRRRKFPAVIKADGLAYGKGVYICKSLEEGVNALNILMIKKAYGDAGNTVIIENYLSGEEYSAHALYDSKKNIKLFPMSKDYKDFNGKNTGGMGAIAPALTGSKNFLNEMTDIVVRPAISKISGTDGACIYPGIIITSNGLRVLEFNMRFGDPETQVYMRLLKSDLLEILLACIEGRLSEIDIEWYDGYAVSVVLASDGYPGKYKLGFRIKGVKNADGLKGVKVFHSNTVRENGKLLTNGGRVLNVTAIGETLEEARVRAYEGVEHIYFEGMCFRYDIGLVPTYQGV